MFARKQHSNSNDSDNKYEQELNDELFISDSNREKFHTLPNSAEKRIIKIELSLNGSTYILLSDGTVFISGHNAHGQLGVGHFDYVYHPQIPKWCQTYKICNIFTGASSKHSLFLTPDGRLFAVGNNAQKQFGMKTVANTLSTWTEITTAIPPKLSVKQIATSSDHTLFLMTNGAIYQTQSKLPYIRCISPNTVTFQDIKCGKSHLLALTDDGCVYSCGLNNNQALSKMDYFSRRSIRVRAIECGEDHCMVLTATNHVYSWGRNDCYQLGTGSNVPHFVGVPQLNEALQHETVVAIKCGAFHNLAITAKNDYFLWGANDFNQCLLNEKTNGSEYDEHDDRRIDVKQFQYAQVPTKLEFEGDGEMEVIGMFLGYKETKIVTTKISWIEHEMNKNANQKQKKAASDGDEEEAAQSATKFKFFQTWYEKWKVLTTPSKRAESKTVSASSSAATRKKTKRRYTSNEDSSTDSSSDCETTSYSPKHPKMQQIFNAKDIKYSRVKVTIQEC